MRWGEKMKADKGVVFKARSLLPPTLLLTFHDLFIILGKEMISFVRICIYSGMLHVRHSVGILVTYIALARALARAIHKYLAGHKEGDGCEAVSGGERTGCREGGGFRGWCEDRH